MDLGPPNLDSEGENNYFASKRDFRVVEASSMRPKQGLNTSLKDPWESKNLKRDKSWWQREWDLCKFFIRWTPYIDESLVCPGLSFSVCGGGRRGSIYTARFSDEEMETVKLTYLHVVEPAWYLVYELCIQQSRGELYNAWSCLPDRRGRMMSDLQWPRHLCLRKAL